MTKPKRDDEPGLLDLNVIQLWELAAALKMRPSRLAEAIDPAVQAQQQERHTKEP